MYFFNEKCRIGVKKQKLNNNYLKLILPFYKIFGLINYNIQLILEFYNINSRFLLNIYQLL